MKVITKKVKLSELKQSVDNPRFITDEAFGKLKKSIESFPEMLEIREIVINEDNEIICGNQRYKALTELGEGEAIVKQVSGLTKDQQTELMLKDNSPTGASGSWDEEVLAKMDNKKLLDWGIDIGFNYDLIDDDAFMGRSSSNSEKRERPYNFRAELTEEQYNKALAVVDGMNLPPRNEGMTNRLGWALMKLIEVYENGSKD